MSKKTLDFCLLKAGKAILHLQTENNSKGVESFTNQCKQQFDLKLEEGLFCMEHTGIYNYPVLDYLSEKQTSVWLGQPRWNPPCILSTLLDYKEGKMIK